MGNHHDKTDLKKPPPYASITIQVMDLNAFREELLRSQPNLARAALLFAREIAYPELDVAAYLNRLDHLARTAEGVLPAEASTIERAEALADYLFGQLGLHGNSQDYYHPDNSYLNRVLEQWVGIPISLAVVYMAIADRLRIPVAGIGLPGHFIIQIPETGRTIYLDPFHGGTRLAESDLVQLVEMTTGHSGPLQAEWLQPVPAQVILTRMLTNLRLIYQQAQEWETLRRVLEHLRVLQPGLADLRRDLGAANHNLDRLRQAIEHYEAYLQQVPEAPDAVQVQQQLQAAAGQLARLN